MSDREIDAAWRGAWREAAKITDTDRSLQLGNDGHPENDCFLSAEKRQRQQAAIAFIAEQTGTSTGFIHRQLLDAAYAEGQARGFDTDPDYLAPPDRDDLAARWRECQIRFEEMSPETASWMRLSNAPSQVDEQFRAGRNPQDKSTTDESRLAAAYQIVADRSGIELVTGPPFDDYGYPILAQGQGMIYCDGSMRCKGDLIGPAATPTGAGQQGEGLHAAVGARPASEVTPQRAPGLTSAVRRASAMFSAFRGARGTTPRQAASHPGGSGIGPSPHQGPVPGESPRSGRSL